MKSRVSSVGGHATHLIRWGMLGALVGVLAGGASALLLESLDRATAARNDHGWLVLLLPLAGLAVGVVYHYAGGHASRGNNLIIDEIHSPSGWVPKRMAPLVLVATVVTHLFGGSAGREGTAIQMSGSLADGWLNRMIRLGAHDRRLLLISAISGGFGSVFGVPVAGCVFALEVQAAGRIRHDAIVPALAAGFVGDRVVAALGVAHTPVPMLAPLDVTPLLVLQLVAAGAAFGLVSLVFAELVHALKSLLATRVAWPPLRPLIGGLAVLGLTYTLGTRDYLGLSLPLIGDSLDAAVGVAALAFAWKLVFTVITLGSGFHGGEVTPLFVVGATLGATLGEALGADPVLFAAIGYVAVFGAAANTPIACTIMGVELFGAEAFVPLAVGCVVAYTIAAGRGIYGAQRIVVSKRGELLDGS